MAKLKSFINTLFTILIFAMALIAILLVVGAYDVSSVTTLIEKVFKSYSNFAIIASSILVILSLIALYSKDNTNENIKSGIAIKSDNGTVYMTKDTFESVIFSITEGYAALKNAKINVHIAEDGVIANIYAYMMPDTVVQTLSSKLQEDVKSTILKQTTIDVKEVNLKIKGVYNQVEKKA